MKNETTQIKKIETMKVQTEHQETAVESKEELFALVWKDEAEGLIMKEDFTSAHEAALYWFHCREHTMKFVAIVSQQNACHQFRKQHVLISL